MSITGFFHGILHYNVEDCFRYRVDCRRKLLYYRFKKITISLWEQGDVKTSFILNFYYCLLSLPGYSYDDKRYYRNRIHHHQQHEKQFDGQLVHGLPADSIAVGKFRL